MPKRAAHHTAKAHEHMDKAMHHHEMASHDGEHNIKATGDMAAVKRTSGGKVTVGPEAECGGRQGNAGISGADPNGE